MRAWPVLVLLASCTSPLPPPPAATDHPSVDLRAQVQAVLSQLESDFYRHWGAVEKTAPFASLGPGHVPFLREIADANGEQALLAFRVLKRLAPGERFTDSARAILYSSALERETNFARWGTLTKTGFLPAVYGDEALTLGVELVPFLRNALQNRRRALLQGGADEERANRIQGDRVCDYAWILLATALHRPYAYEADPERRDYQIRDFDLWLDRPRK